jgi:hypothetical protein
MTQRDVTLPVFGPVEDLALGILKPFFEGTGVNVQATFTEDMHLPIIVARQDRKSGGSTHYADDARFMKPALLSVDTITGGPNADEDGAHLQEAVRIALHEAWFKQIVVPGVGYIAKIENSGNASRTSDWATSTGVVQYASLPKGAIRYDNTFRLYLRPDNDQTRTINPFVRKVNL